ncbi:glucose/arabinose dehydrogenase [Novosphingobium kunmingense]|uniref:Glucose/arabinose dehydrogenase n=1 Tax=Novosphingobium kunmingense TaxID=1211806 RepID=A0A2N0H533_9SPHN|nr:PQQ-dependent sugar dehydrogenase [Novosphingobium kunmingense]PKB14032.1 glucose/arabinose dehydrogenase [Novosphingobium kunmingense]
MSTKRKLLVALGIVLLVIGGFAFYLLRGTPAEKTLDQLSGRDPQIVAPKPENFPSIGIAKPVGWAAGEAPAAAQGLVVGRFAEGLDHPRVMLTLPNGDVLVSLADAPPSKGGGLTGWIADVLMKRAGSHTGSPNALVLLRDVDGDGRAEARFTLRQNDGLSSPSGLAWGKDTLYVANHDAVLSFPYKLGETALTGAPKKLMDLPAAGNHWMRNLILSADGQRLYVAVGSASNIGENGMEAEKGRAAIWELNLTTGYPRQFAQGLRNPNGLDWNPATGELWTVVNERDQLGPDLVPDYLTNVPIGAHYGWPWIYYKTFDDDRVTSQPPEFIDDYVRKPEFALGAHTAPLGLAFTRGGEKLGAGFASGAVIARHGSWNRKPLSGYDVVFVAFDANGNPQGLPVPLLNGFLVEGKNQTRGRPTWVAFARDGALLVTDDTAGIVWRVIAPNAAPGVAIKPVVTERMPPQRQLDGDPAAQFKADFRDDAKVKQ